MKTAYDPHNLFNVNWNIRPRSAAGTGGDVAALSLVEWGARTLA